MIMSRASLLTALALCLPTTEVLAHHPHDPIDALCVVPGYPDDPRVFLASDGSINLFLQSRNLGYTWSESRHGLLGFRVAQIEAPSDFATSGILYVSTGEAGMQRSTDGGVTWGPPLVDKNIRYIATVPGSRRVYCTTYQMMFVSEDGENFRHAPEFPSNLASIQAMAVPPQPGTDVVAFATADGTVYFSRDGARTWTETATTADIRDIEFSPRFAADGTLYLATFGQGVLKSSNGGKTFRPARAGLNDAFINDLAIAPRARRGETQEEIWAACKDDGVYVTRDGAEEWTLTSLAVPEKHWQSDNHFRILRVSPDYPRTPTVYCGTFEGLYISRDGGAVWRKTMINPTRMGRKLAISPDYARDRSVFCSGYGMQLIASYDAGDSWELRCTDIHALSGYAFSVSPDFPREPILMLGVDRGIRRSSDGGKTWQSQELLPYTYRDRESSYEVRDIEFSPDFAADQIVWAINKGALYRSSDRGLTWKSGPPYTPFAARLAFSPEFSRDRIAFLGGKELFRSKDGGESFEGPIGDFSVSDMKVAPDFARSGEVYVISMANGFFVSTDRGLHFEDRSADLDGHHPSALQLSPDFARDGTLFITTTGGGVFRSDDRGHHLRRVTAVPSPVDHAVSFVISPDFTRDQTLFIGNYNGVWRSRDAGENWTLQTKEEFYDNARQPWERHGSFWLRHHIPDCINRGVSFTTYARHKMILPFTGRSVRLYGTQGPDHGRCEIVLDGERKEMVDCYSPELKTQVVLADFPDIGFGFHTLTVHVLGTKVPQSGGTRIGIDGAMVDYTGPDDQPVKVYSTWDPGISAALQPTYRLVRREAQAPARVIQISVLCFALLLGVTVLIFGRHHARP